MQASNVAGRRCPEPLNGYLCIDWSLCPRGICARAKLLRTDYDEVMVADNPAWLPRPRAFELPSVTTDACHLHTVEDGDDRALLRWDERLGNWKGLVIPGLRK